MEGERVSPLSVYLYTPFAVEAARTCSLGQVSALEREDWSAASECVF